MDRVARAKQELIKALDGYPAGQMTEEQRAAVTQRIEDTTSAVMAILYNVAITSQTPILNSRTVQDFVANSDYASAIEYLATASGATSARC